MRHEQQTPDIKWEIVHNLNTDKIQVECWVEVAGALTKIQPKRVETSNETVIITFIKPRSGFVVIHNQKRWCDL